jgi:phospholipid/cholesterol/gamma-HCH transport system substrate-binding protein
VEVVMDIDAKTTQYIHKDAKVKLGTDGFIGNRILIIYDGTPSEPTIDENDTLKFVKTLSTDDLINTLQANNENLKSITGDFKIISKKLAEGEGTIGKLLNDDSFYNNINSTAASLQKLTSRAQQVINSLAEFSKGLEKDGTLAHELTSDTVVFNDLKASIKRLNQVADTASVLINHLKEAESNTKTPIGTLLHDEETGADLRQTIKNLEVTTTKLNEDLEGLKHSFPLKRYFKKKEKAGN